MPRKSNQKWTLVELHVINALKNGEDRDGTPRSLRETADVLCERTGTRLSRQRVQQLLLRRVKLMEAR